MLSVNLPKVKTVFAPYAVKIGEELFGGQKFGVSDIETKFTTQRTATLDQYLGLFIDFPLTASNEDEGFGQCHTVDYRLRTPVPCKFRRLVVKFPREVEVTFRVATEEGISKLPEGKASMSWVEVVLKKGAKVSVEGFGLPYANVNHPAHEWLQHPDSAPVVGDKTLLDILQQEKFTFIVSEPHPRFPQDLDREFEPCRNSVYKDVACTYSPGTDVELPSHRLGHVLEEFIQAKLPYIKPSKPDGEHGTLSPLFVDCRNSFCYTDPITHSRRNWDQIKAAFNFLADFVKTKQVNPASILIIAPYSAMVEAAETFRNKREYKVLKEMQPPSTDSRRPVPTKEPTKPPKPTLSDIGVEAGVWKDDRNAEAIDSIASRGHGSKSAKRKAEDDGRSVRRAKAKEPSKKAYCTVSVTEKSGLNIKWKDKTSSFAGPDKVQLIGYTTFSRVKFKAIEKHNRFQRQTTNKINRDYIISLSRQRIKHFAATGASDETPFIHYTLRPTQVLKPLLAAAAQEDMLQELL
ncbi:hypothetical protein ACHAPM_007003 [Fusarium culmorum]